MPADLESVPTDRVADDLIRTYRAGATRLETQLRQALNAGLNPDRVGTPAQISGDATAAYRQRQLRAANLIIGELEAHGRRAAPAITGAAYRANMVAVDRHAARQGLEELGARGRFGGIHQRTVETLAANMSQSLTAAAGRARENVAAVFARADALEGALPVGGSPLRGFPFIGRRTNDPWRRVALETIGAGNVGIDTRRQISRSMARQLVREGVTDALTGFVDRGGRRWSLPDYCTMVARTTTREAASRATSARLADHGLDLVTISSHPHAADECTPYDGQTFSLSGDSDTYDALDVYPPFHPNCRHVITPAGADLDEFLGDVDSGVDDELGVDRSAPAPKPSPPPSTTPAPPGPTTPALGRKVAPTRDEHTAAAFDAQETAYAIANDPGPEPGAAEAWAKWTAKEGREASKALDTTLGEFNAHQLGLKWATDARLRERLLNGETTIEEAELEIEHNWQHAEGKRVSRQAHNETDFGYKKASFPCFSCGSFKRRPADVCAVCGDDPVPTAIHRQSKVGESAASAAECMEFNRAYGYAPV